VGVFHGHGVAEPIALECLAGALVASGYRVSFRDRLELEVREPISTGRTVSLFSSLTHEWSEVVGLAAAARRRGAMTLVGGYHVAGMEESAPAVFDRALKGEGEEVVAALVAELLVGGRRWAAATRLPAGSSPRTILAPRIADVDGLPRPLRDESFLRRYKLWDLMWPPPTRQRNAALVLASRGCSHSCSFCASEAVWGKGLRLRRPAKVVDEVRDLVRRFDTNTAVFIDQSLGQAPDWTLALCHELAAAQLGVSWYNQSNLDLRPDLVPAMAAAGCTKIGFGVEGLSPGARRRVKPGNPRDLHQINAVFDRCNAAGIFVKAYLIIGFPWETEADLAAYADGISHLRANEVKISYFVPFPGARDWVRYKDRLISIDWADFDTVRLPVVHNPHIPVARYHAVRQALFHRFYGSTTYGEVTASFLRRFPHSLESYREFATYLRAHGMVTGREEWLRWVQAPTILAVRSAPSPEVLQPSCNLP